MLDKTSAATLAARPAVPFIYLMLIDGRCLASNVRDYLRHGDSSGLGKFPGYGGYELPCLGQIIPQGHTVFGDLYAMPAATVSLLEDKAVDLRKWLLEETLPVFKRQIEEGKWPDARIGRASVLRDPYTVKPYILFYVTAKVFCAEPLQGQTWTSGTGNQPRCSEAELDANARLIAAAPDMLGALIAVRARFQNLRLTADHEIVLDRVNAAIAKAKSYRLA